jgi:hypothetical protein
VYYQKMSDMEDIDKAIRSAARKGDEEAWLRFVQVKREYIEREFK